MLNLVALANASGLSKEQLLGWNPALTPQASWIPAGYRVKLPVDAVMEPIVEVALYQPRPNPSVARGKTQLVKLVRHYVRPGETIAKIAQHYGASVQRILQVNGLRQANFVRVGSMLVIPRA